MTLTAGQKRLMAAYCLGKEDAVQPQLGRSCTWAQSDQSGATGLGFMVTRGGKDSWFLQADVLVLFA